MGQLTSISIAIIGAITALGTMAFGLKSFSGQSRLASQLQDHEAALRAVEERNSWLTLTEEHAKVGHWRLDLASNEIFWSAGTFAMHGLEPGTPPTLQDAIEFYHPDDRSVVQDYVEQSRETGKAYTFKARLMGADGKLRNVESRASVEVSKTGDPIALFGVIKDRTAEEEMLLELRNSRDEAKALAQAKSMFLARMSHEIRTPMNGVLGFAELLSRSDLTEVQQRHINLILDSGRSLQSLLNDILDLTKAEAGKIEIEAGQVDIHHLVRRVTQLSESAAREKSILLACDIAPDVPRHISTDALRVRQILSNILANAVRFTDRGAVSLSLRRSENLLHFSIHDTGTGIAKSMLTKIFDPFTQEHANPVFSRGGTGLGLAISQQLAEHMGGSISVESELGAGSIFTLTLPLAQEASAPSTLPIAVSPTPPLEPAGTARILLVEDYDINRELITEMMRQLGHDIECAVDGLEAIAMVKRARESGNPYSLVFMDLQMPKLDGLEATRSLRSAGIGAQELPIIALTANAFADDIKSCLSAGMQAHLAKPLSMDQLRRELERWLSGPTEFEQAAVSA